MSPWQKNIQKGSWNKNFILALLLFGSAFSTISCSVYKSDGRKNLESAGPPPGSIRAASINVLILDSSRSLHDYAKADIPVYEVCRQGRPDKALCTQNLICIQAPYENLEQISVSEIAFSIEQNLLVDKNDIQKIFAHALICKISL